MVVEFAPADRRYDNPAFGIQGTGGSTSTAAYWEIYRKAGATAREMLLEAAARTWGVTKSECVAENGAIVHPPTKRSGRFGELAETAAHLSVPHVSSRARGTSTSWASPCRASTPARRWMARRCSASTWWCPARDRPSSCAARCPEAR